MVNSELCEPGILLIVISDLMGTLTTGSPVLGLLDWVSHNQSRTQARLLMASMIPGYLMVKSGLADVYPWSQKLMVDSLSWLHDVTPEKFEEIAGWAVEHNLWQKRRADVVSRLSEHAESGAQVYIASSVVEPIVLSFARRIGVQAIGTPLQFDDGHARVATSLVASDRKIQEVLDRLDVTRVDYAYGDTAMDIPLLEHADHPVAVYPDKRLYTAARERGWQIFGEPQ
jgi:phosphoserine phosphatase